MHYYQFNIADYRKDTTHFSMIEHGAYRQLLDWMYLSEQPIPKETQVVMRRLSARTDEDIAAIQTVLKEMFTLTENGYIQARCMGEIEYYNAQADRARVNGKLGGRPKKTKVVILDNPDITQTKANSITKELNNSVTQELKNSRTKELINPKPKSKDLARASRLPPEWQLPKDWGMWAKTEKPDLQDNEIRKIADEFRDYWIAVPGSKGVKAEWYATWRNWVRKQSYRKKPNNADRTEEIRRKFLGENVIEGESHHVE